MVLWDLKVNVDRRKLMVLDGGKERRMRSLRMVHDWSKCHSSNIWDVFWVNQVQMLPNLKGGWLVRGK